MWQEEAVACLRMSFAEFRWVRQKEVSQNNESGKIQYCNPRLQR